MTKDMTWLKEALIAHRGLHTADGRVPENSASAFSAAIGHGYAIETDVNILKDGTVVCFHDPGLKRMTGREGLLKDMTAGDLENVRLNGTDETIMTFEAFLDLVAGRVPVLVEIKPYGDMRRLVRQVAQRLAAYHGQNAVFSFHPSVVLMLRTRYPELIRGQIAESFKDGKHVNGLQAKMMERMVFNRFTKPDFISYGIKDLPNRHADRARISGLTVISYVARTPEDLDRIRTLYDNAVFEFFTP
jgi:glycerophosphoryl diester phosphodiesterase